MVLKDNDRIITGREIAEMRENLGYTFEEIAQAYTFSTSTTRRLYLEYTQLRDAGFDHEACVQKEPNFIQKLLNWLRN